MEVAERNRRWDLRKLRGECETEMKGGEERQEKAGILKRRDGGEE